MPGIKAWDKIRQNVERSETNRLKRLKEYHENKSIRKVVDMWAEEKLRPKILDDKQRMAIYYLADFTHSYSYQWVATKINIPVHILTKWRNDPLFLKHLDREIDRRRSFIRVHAWRNVHRDIIRGNMKSTWKYLEMIGDFKRNINITDDRTGEKELSDDELKQQIDTLQAQLNVALTPSGN